MMLDTCSGGSRMTDRGGGPLDALWRARTVLWMVAGGQALATVIVLAAQDVSMDRWQLLLRLSVVVHWILLLSLITMYATRRWLSRLRPVAIAYAALCALLLSTWVTGALLWLLLRDLMALPPAGWHSLLLRATGIALAVGLLGLAAFQNHWRARQLAVRAKQAELEALQARIRPHFLFNTLNTGAALVHQRPEEAERLLVDLADLFRAALAGPRDIPLADELALARRYLEIESLRFGDRLGVDWHLPAPLPAVTVPALSIQPLVENAIRHGIERIPGGGRIEVAVHSTGGSVVIRVTNPLPGGGASTSHPDGHRVGLRSSRARIEALTGGHGRLDAAAKEGRYVATVSVPHLPPP